jgi:hypothetical protein
LEKSMGLLTLRAWRELLWLRTVARAMRLSVFWSVSPKSRLASDALHWRPGRGVDGENEK